MAQSPSFEPSPFLPAAFVARASTGMKPGDAARAIGVKPSALKAWEDGKGEAPEDVLRALATLAAPRLSRDTQFSFIDLFAGIGGIRRAFEGAGGECVLTAEWNRSALETYLANHGGDHPVVGDIRLLSASDVPDHDVLAAGFPCFPAGTMIETEMGLRPIEAISVGDMVATHARRMRPVLTTMSRTDAEIIEVKVTGVPAIETTDEHPFYVRKRTRRWNNDRRGYDYAFGAPEWVEAAHLDGDCFAALPVDSGGADGDGWRDDAYWYLVGRWLGDGWIVDVPRHEEGREGQRMRRAVVCTGSDDADALAEAIERAGFHATRAPEKTVVKFHICSHSFVDFLVPFGRGAHAKQVAPFLFSAPLRVQRAVWRGWLDADGHKVKDSVNWEGCTVSRALALGMARLARNAFGKVATVRRSKVAAHTIIEGRTVNQRDQYKVVLADRNGGHTFIEHGFAWVKVKSVKATGRRAEVFNIEVDEDNSYVAESVVVHNCQPFSLAGVSKKNSLGRPHGFADETQGTLFFDVARIIQTKRPRAFLLENVRNLLSHDKGRTFEVIRRTLADELGYAISWRVLDGSAWVPQRRPRIFIVGIRDGEAFNFDEVEVPVVGPRLGDILHAEGELDADERFAPGGIVHPRYTLTDGLWRFLQGYAEKHRSKGNGFGYGLVGPGDVARTMSARYGKDGSEILIRNGHLNPRRLTPRECARLMGFDGRDGGPGMVIPVSDAQAYKQFGNSVVVPCVSAIAKALTTRLARDQAMSSERAEAA